MRYPDFSGRRVWCSAMLSLLTLLLALPTADAQPLPGTLHWEVIPHRVPFYRDSLAFTEGVVFIADTLLASTLENGTLALRTDLTEWEAWKNDSDLPRAADGRLRVFNSAPLTGREEGAGEHLVFLDRTRRIYHTADYGRTWTDIFPDFSMPGSYTNMPVRGPGGALFAGTNAFGNGADSILRSTDHGETWAVFGDYAGFFPWALAYTEPTAEAPDGRFVAADARGLLYSHDGALTWTRAADWWDRATHDVVVAVLPGRRDGGHAGRFLADVYLGGENASAILASDDGGMSWTEVFRFPRAGSLIRLYAAPDGAVYVHKDGIPEAPELYGSGDGGDTWRFLGRVEATWPEDDPPLGVPDSVTAGGPWAAWSFGIEQLAAGPDGHLYAGGAPRGPRGFDDPGGGVLRTTEPVVLPVAAEPPAEAGEGGFGVRAVPNPSGGAVTLLVTGASNEASVRIEVLDVLGRAILLLHDGAMPSGGRYSIPAGTLAPGSYVVRIATENRAATALFTVAD